LDRLKDGWQVADRLIASPQDSVHVEN